MWGGGPLAAGEIQVEGPGATVIAEDLSEQAARAYLAKVIGARAKVEAWWGKTYTGDLRVEVNRSNRIAMAMVPAWRGNWGTVLMPRYRVVRGSDPTMHEIVHVYAPNQNRFLAEGVATYAHFLLGGNPAFPTFGDDLGERAKAIARKIDLRILDGITTPTPLTRSGYDNVDCYIVAGSFVGFLIETYGMETFRKHYALTPFTPGKRTKAGDPDRWTKSYGKRLPQLGAEWRRKIGAAR